MRPVILSILRDLRSPLELHETSPENASTTSRAVNTQLSIAVPPPTLPEAAVTSRHSSEPPSATESATKLPEGESDRFIKLLADLRAKLHTIRDESTLATIMDYVKYTANPPPSLDLAVFHRHDDVIKILGDMPISEPPHTDDDPYDSYEEDED
ncbi:hypothetical protein VE00_03135 [Pseudogymnoascus sp. WSF 3629]|nr:hypothetical protein VE00_03135 [Pseudogymnoascus sp. WSF 3629]